MSPDIISNIISLLQDTISILHNATTAGIVPVVQELMTSERLALSRDQYGATPLHKAVLFYQPKLVKLISEKFPLTTKVYRILVWYIIYIASYIFLRPRIKRAELHFTMRQHFMTVEFSTDIFLNVVQMS